MTGAAARRLIRGLSVHDAAAVAALLHVAFAAQSVRTDPPPGALAETAESIRARIVEGGGACLACGGALVGVVLWEERQAGLHLGRLAVHPAWRRQGVARALLAAAEAEARRRGLRRLHLGARLALAENRALFAACGFAETGLATHAGHAAPTSVTMEKRLA